MTRVFIRQLFYESFYLDSFFIRKNNTTSFLQNHNRNGCDNAIPQQYEIFHSFPLHENDSLQMKQVKVQFADFVQRDQHPKIQF